MTEIEKKRAYLENYWYIEEELNNIDLEARQIVSDVRGIKAMEYSDMPGGHKKTDLSDKIVMLESRLESLKEKKAELIDKKYGIINVINSLSNTRDRNVLLEKYVNKMNNEMLGDKLGYGERQIKRIVKNAISEINI